MTNLIAPEVPMLGEDPILPHPLKDGEPTRSAPDGTRLWNPVWPLGPAQGPVNPGYILASIRLVQSLEQVSLTCLATLCPPILFCRPSQPQVYLHICSSIPT
jgi:hypothetical protein